MMLRPSAGGRARDFLLKKSGSGLHVGDYKVHSLCTETVCANILLEFHAFMKVSINVFCRFASCIELLSQRRVKFSLNYSLGSISHEKCLHASK